MASAAKSAKNRSITMNSTTRILPHLLKSALPCFLLIVCRLASAGTGPDLWTGAGGTANWSLAGNWDPASSNTPPASGDTPAFGTVGAGGAALNNDISGGSYLGLQFDTGAPSFILNGDPISTTGGIFDNSTNLQTINFGIVLSNASHSLFSTNGGLLVINGMISDAGQGCGITLSGWGTVSLGETNDFTGATTINAGTLELDFDSLSASSGGMLSNNIINIGSPLSFGGGTLDVNGSTLVLGAGFDTTNTQSFDNTTFAAGNSMITFSGGTNATLELGALAETLGATVVINGVATIGAGNVPVPAAGTITTSVAGAGPIGLLWGTSTLSGYATVGAYDWAATLNGTIVGGSQVPGFYTSYSGGNNAIAGNADIAGSSGSHNTDSGVSMRFNTPAPITFNLTSIVDGAGILVTPNVGPNNIILTAASGQSYEGDRSGNNRAWVFWQNNTNALVILNAPVTDTKSSTDASVQSGPGTMVYLNTAQPSYSLATYLNGGVAEVNSDTELGTATLGSTVYLNGGTVLGSASMTLDSAGTARRPFAIGLAGGGLAAVSNTTLIVDGLITNAGATAGPLAIGIPGSSANGFITGLVPGTGANTPNAATNATGTVVLSGSNAYAGGTILYSGTLNFNSASLGTGGITFSGGTLQWASGTATDVSAQTVAIDAGGGTMDLGGQTVTLANTIGMSGRGSLTVTNGTLILGAGNTYAGGTAVGSGATLIARNSSGSATGSGAVTVQSGGTLEGPGAISGAVTTLPGGSFNPGGSGVGTATVGSLTLSAGSVYDIDFSGGANSQIVVANSSGLVINGGAFNLAGLSAPGTYNLIQYSGAVGGSGLDATWTSSSDANPHLVSPDQAFLYSFALNGGFLTVTVAPNLSAIISDWTNNVDGLWSAAANWSPNRVPHSPGDAATFGASASLRTVTLDADETVGALSFTNANSFVIAGSTTTLTLDNSGAPVSVAVTGGAANAIHTGVSLNSPFQVSSSAGAALAISGSVSNAAEGTPQTLHAGGSGTLALSGNNSYGPAAAGTVGTTLTGGTLQVGSGAALGAGDLAINGSSTLQAGASVSVANNIDIAPAVNATVDTQAASLALFGTLTDSGNITKTGAGTLTLGGNNINYTGTATVNAGTLSVSSDANLGAESTLVLNGGGLAGAGSVTLTRDVNIGLALGAVGTNAYLDAVGSADLLQINGAIGSAGNTGLNNLTINGHGGAGTVELLGADSFDGTTVVAGGLVDVANSGALQNSLVDYDHQGGGMVFDFSLVAATFGGFSGGQDLALTNEGGAGMTLTVGGDNLSTVYSGNFTDGGFGGALIKDGSGTLTLTGNDSYTGTTTVNGGVLELPTGAVLNVGTLAGGSYLIDGGTLSNAPTTVNSLAQINHALWETAGAVTLGEVTQANNDAFQIQINGGIFSTPNLALGRSFNYGATAPGAATPIAAQTANGFWVNSTNTLSPAQVYLGQMTIGITAANSSTSFRLDAGSVTVTNEVLLGDTSNTRYDVMQINGGNFTNLDMSNGLTMSINDGANGNNSELYLSGGTTYLNILNFGSMLDAVGGTAVVIITNSSLYMGAGGIDISNDAGLDAVIYLETGILGAAANWSSAVNGDGLSSGFLLGLAGNSFTIQAADPNNVPYDISLTGSLGGPGNLVKTGGGILTLGGLNVWTGTTTVSDGTLALSGDGATTGVLLDSTSVNVFAPGVINVAGLTNDTLHLGDAIAGQGPQALTGSGLVSGNVVIGTSGTLAPGSAAGGSATLTISGNLTNSGALALKVGHPGTGATNDSIAAQSISNTPGSTLTVVQGANDLITGDSFKLFNIAGNAGLSAISNAILTLPANAPISGVAYVWNTNNLAINGTISLTSGASSIPTASTNLAFSVSGGVLHLSWPANYLGWSLQSNSISLSATNDWITIPGSSGVTSENLALPATGSVFFRMELTH